jgi:hypothetical protein
MATTVQVIDEASPWLEWAAREFPDFTRSALKSTGWWLSREIKKGIRSGAPGGKPYAPRMPAKKRRALEKAMGGRVKRSYPWMGQLSRAVGYEYRQGENAVVIGPLSSSAVALFKKHESGTSYPVTQKVRKAYAAAGIYLSRGTKYIKLPRRETIGPVYQAYRNRISPYIEDKITSYMAGKKIKPRRTKRRYQVVSRWI